MKLQRYAAEFIGTFALTLAVSLSLLVEFPFATPLIAALTLGLFVYTVGSISGAHLNPSITIALATIRKISWMDALCYIVAQILGALLAMFVSERLAGGTLELMVLNEPLIGMVEALGAGFLAFGVAAVVHERVKSEASGLVIGGSLLLGIMLAANFSNGILNPAVAIGLGSISAMYVFGPIAGAVIAMWIYKYLQQK